MKEKVNSNTNRLYIANAKTCYISNSDIKRLKA